MSAVPSGTLRGTPKGKNAHPAGTSAIPRPAHSEVGAASGTGTTHSEAGASSTMSASRQKQTRRDEAIRLKAEKELGRRKGAAARARTSRKAPPGSVLSLKPSQALQIKPNTTVAEAAQMMAAKREDCVLVTDDDDRIAGIFTAKDLAFRVVGAGLKARDVKISEIMTHNPLCARTDTSATDALDLMVRKGFRHLPVMDENHDISGILDITKCFYDAMEKLERAYSSSRALYDAMQGVQQELGSSQPQQIIQYVEALRQKMSGPTLESVLTGLPPATVSVRTSVKEAASIMKENHTTAVLVQDQGQITGIFTSKDVVLRVIAAGLDPQNCSVVRVMTPHPDFAPMDMSIQAALRKMHDGHYLNLPVMSEAGEIVGMVDVLKLTYATLDQVNSMSTGDNEGPAWQKFWLAMDNDTESQISGDGSQLPRTPVTRSVMSRDHHNLSHLHSDAVMPDDSASHHGADVPESPPAQMAASSLVPTTEETPLAFKFKAPSGRVHRLQVTAKAGMQALVEQVASKLGGELEAVGGSPDVDAEGHIGKSGFALSYLDNEGDTVSITTAQDILEAIDMARQNRKDKVDLFVHHPEQPPLPASLEPARGNSADAGLRERRKRFVEEEHEEEEPHFAQQTQTRQLQQEQVIQGVPNELLLPGAIAALAVVIVGVFTISRLSSK